MIDKLIFRFNYKVDMGFLDIKKRVISWIISTVIVIGDLPNVYAKCADLRLTTLGDRFKRR